MNRSLLKIIDNWVPENSKVIDLGCGDGSLITELSKSKNIIGYGVEVNAEKIASCIANGVSVVQEDIDDGVETFNGMGFDLSVMASSIQCLRNPNLALENMLNMSKKTIVTLPNFGYWKCRLGLLKGSMPITDNLPKTWYETNNLHLCTIKDFENLCTDMGFTIEKKKYLDIKSKESFFAKLFPNLFAAEGVYLLSK